MKEPTEPQGPWLESFLLDMWPIHDTVELHLNVESSTQPLSITMAPATARALAVKLTEAAWEVERKLTVGGSQKPQS